MASLNVNGQRQQGSSLIELLIGALMGLVTIATIGTVFVTGQKLAAQRSKQLMLAQSLSSIALQIKEDVQRAGFNGDDPSVALSGGKRLVYSDNESEMLGYVYRIAQTGSDLYRNVVFKRELSDTPNQGDKLKICEKYSESPLTVSAASLSGVGGYCFNLFNPDQISISEFSISNQSIDSELVRSQMLTIALSGHLVTDSAVTYRTQIASLLRNVQ